MKRKLVIALSIIIFLFNTIITDIVLATEDKSVMEHHSETGQETTDSLMEGEKVTVYPESGQRKATAKDSRTQGAGTAETLASLLAILPGLASKMMTLVINSGSTVKNGRISIQNIVFDEYALFNINFFSPPAGLRGSNDFNKTFSESVAQWFVTCRNISIVILLGMLIYVGIRMAISVVAQERAKYKKMFIGWIESMVILFVIQYIFIFCIMLSENMMNLIRPVMQSQSRLAVEAKEDEGFVFKSDVEEKDKNFETILVTDLTANMEQEKGWNKLIPAIEYFVLIFYQVKFFIVYLMRKLRVGFLIMIAPFITVTYPADKVGDNKAQAFSAWLQEIIYQIFVINLHSIIYLVFVASAAAIASKAPAVSLIFLMGLSNSEKIIKKIFNVKGKGLADTVSYKKLKKGGKGK